MELKRHAAVMKHEVSRQGCVATNMEELSTSSYSCVCLGVSRLAQIAHDLLNQGHECPVASVSFFISVIIIQLRFHIPTEPRQC